MANLTVTSDEDVLRRARIRALEQATSGAAVGAEFFARFAGLGATASALEGFLDLAARSDAGSGSSGRPWGREDVHDRPDLLWLARLGPCLDPGGPQNRPRPPR